MPGTVTQVTVEHLPHARTAHKDLWLWHADPPAADVDLLRKAYLRRFDQEHRSPGLRRGRRPLDSPGHRRLHATPARPEPRGRPASTLAAAAEARHGPEPLPGPPRIPSPTHTTALPRPAAKTPPPDPRAPQGLEEQTQGHPPRLPQQPSYQHQPRSATNTSITSLGIRPRRRARTGDPGPAVTRTCRGAGAVRCCPVISGRLTSAVVRPVSRRRPWAAGCCGGASGLGRRVPRGQEGGRRRASCGGRWPGSWIRLRRRSR